MQKEDSLQELERELRNRTEEVETLKKGYDDFISLASHDLLSPVRKITTLLERFEQKCKGSIPEEANTYLERINHSLSTMSSLVNNITKLSLVRANPAMISAVNVNMIFDKILLNYKSEITAGEIVIHHDDIPLISSNEKDLEQLFKEIVVNAIKFKKPNIAAEIRVIYERLNEEEKRIYDLNPEIIFGRISIHDNGIGFKQDMAERIVKPFQRLHGNSTYPGNGIGLAICKKIAEVNGGIFTATGKENEGASFSVILPEFQNQ